MTKTPDQLLYLLDSALAEIRGLRGTIERLTPKAQAFDLLVHTHLGRRLDLEAVTSPNTSYELAVTIDEIETEQANTAAETERKAAEKAKAAKVRKPRKPKTPETPPPAEPGQGSSEPQPEDPAPPATQEPAPEGSRRRRGIFGGTAPQT